MSTLASDDDTPVRNRTRSAILNAAIAVLTTKPTAALSDVADAAGVARSTLHRYFPDRVALIAAVNAFAEEQVATATSQARIDEGLAADALVRLCHGYFDHWHNITWAYMERERQSPDECQGMDLTDDELTALIERGYADGTIDPGMTNGWIQQLLWAVLYSAWEYIRLGANRHDVVMEVERTIRKLVRPA